jgi:uncharacterized membrane protein SirB2
MSYEFYKILHIAALLFVVFGLFGYGVICWNQSEVKPELKKYFMISHGVGLLVMLIAGFGMAAKLGLHPFPGWLYGKLFIWLILGAMATLIKRISSKSRLWIALTFILVCAAVILAITKPF